MLSYDLRRWCEMAGFPLETKGPRLSAYYITKLVHKARTDLRSLQRLGVYCEEHDVSESMSTKLQANCLDVFCYHLSDPIDGHQYDEEPDLRNKLHYSFMGITCMARCIKESPTLAAKFVKAWPDIMKWLKVVFDAGFLREPKELLFFKFASDVLALAATIHKDGLDNPTAFEIAFVVWIGRPLPDGTEIYRVDPLLYYIKQTETRARSVSDLLRYYENDAVQIVDKLLSRLTASVDPIRGDLEVMNSLVLFMIVIVYSENTEPIKSALVTSYTAAICARVAITLVSDEEVDAMYSPVHALSLFGLFETLYFCVNYLGHPCSSVIVEAGFLLPLLKVASLENTALYKRLDFKTAFFLALFIQHLAFEGMVRTCRMTLEELYGTSSTIQDSLKLSSAGIQQAWFAFEMHLLEQAVLSRIFEGHSSERGVCANKSCSVMAIRKEFRKCAGCAVALYCSDGCQAADWVSHRLRCKEMHVNDLNRICYKPYRFPRRVASAHIARYWRDLEALATSKGISKENIAIRVSFAEFPNKIEVLDVHDFLDENHSQPPDHSLVASEYLRLAEKHCGFAMVILRCHAMPDVAYLAYLDVLQYNNQGTVFEADGDEADEVLYSLYTNERREDLRVHDLSRDAVRAGVQCARSIAAERGEMSEVFKDDVIGKAADMVINVLGRADGGPQSEPDLGTETDIEKSRVYQLDEEVD